MSRWDVWCHNPPGMNRQDSDVTMRLKEFLDEAVGKYTSLGQAVHAFANLNIDVLLAIVSQVPEVVELHDCRGNHGNEDAHVFIFGHRCVKVEVFEVPCHMTGVMGRDDAVEMDLRGGHVSWCSCSADVGFASQVGSQQQCACRLAFCDEGPWILRG